MIQPAIERRDFLKTTGGATMAGLLDSATGVADAKTPDKHGINEHYDSLSGKPLGVPDYCMSCTLVTMMLDGLAQRHRLKMRDQRPAQ